MTYDDKAKRLAIKAIGTVESRLNYEAINYDDPITVGIMQWYGVRAANILFRMRDENPEAWVGVADSINLLMTFLPANDPQWNDKRLTQAEGESLRPILGNNRSIQDDQAIRDMEVYREVALNSGIDPDSNTDSMIFFFSMYHQGPVYAFQVLNAIGGSASLEQFRAGALANPVLGQYSNRYNEVYEIIKTGEVDETPGDGGSGDEGENPTPAPVALKIKYLDLAGSNILIHFENETITCYPATSGTWLPSRQPKAVAPVDPVDPVDPETPPETPDPPVTGTGWTHPLPGATLTSGYGFREGYDQPGLIHAGIDLSTTTAVIGGWVLAPCDLEITQSIENGAGGFADAGSFVKGITTSGEPYTLSFFHMGGGTLQVQKGQKVSKGARLGRESQTGYAFGTHLHLEIWPGHKVGGFRFDSPWYYGDGTPIDPIPVFSANGVTF